MMWQVIFLALVLAGNPATFAMMTDKPAYHPGEEMVIIIYTREPNGQWVSLTLDGPTGYHPEFFMHQISTPLTTLFMTIPENVTLGNYTLTMTWEHQYRQVRFEVTNENAIPEFPSVIPIFALSIMLLFVTLNLSRKRI